MTPDELDELSRSLFASAQLERPSDELRARVLAARRVHNPASASNREPNAAAVRQPSASKRRFGGRTMRFLLAAAALAALPLAWRRLSSSRVDEALITAEKSAPRASVSAVPQGATPFSQPDPNEAPVARTNSASPSGAPTPLPSTAPLPVAHSGPVAPQPSAQTSAALAASAPGAPSAAAPAESSTPAPQVTLAQELGWLQRTRALLRAGDSQGALRLLDSHDAELRASDMSTEATVLRIEALSAVGRGTEATALARRFIAENANSPLVDRARSLLLQAEKNSPHSEPAAP